MANCTCDHWGRKHMHQRSLGRHVTRNHNDHPVFGCGQCERSFARFSNLEKHKRSCTGGTVVVPVAAPAAKKRRISVALEFKLRKTRELLEGAVEQFTVNIFYFLLFIQNKKLQTQIKLQTWIDKKYRTGRNPLGCQKRVLYPMGIINDNTNSDRWWM